MRILIAEDETISRRKLERQLKQWGYDVSSAENGVQAWEMYQQGEFNLIISDWNMPEMDGPTLVRTIRSSEDYGYVYIILLTARSDKDDLVAGMQAGADDFLSKPFDRHELQVRITAGERIVSLEQNLADRNRELENQNARMQRDLDAAAQVQLSLLPTQAPDTAVAEFAWRAQPCDELGGDSLGVFSIDHQHVVMYVADVSGHGVAASLLAVAINRALAPTRSSHDGGEARRIVSPALIATELNERFPIEETEKFFTMTYGILNLETLKFQFVSAGHPPLVHITEQEDCQVVESAGFPVGIVDEPDFEDETLQLKPGDRLYLYSDGVPEAMSPAQEEFGDERLLQSVKDQLSNNLDASVGVLMKQVDKWCAKVPHDDVTILAVEILHPHAAT